MDLSIYGMTNFMAFSGGILNSFMSNKAVIKRTLCAPRNFFIVAALGCHQNNHMQLFNQTPESDGPYCNHIVCKWGKMEQARPFGHTKVVERRKMALSSGHF
jgi:phenolic acid decarboxylase